MTNFSRYEALAKKLEALKVESHETLPSRHLIRHFAHSTLALMFPQFREDGGRGSTLSLSLASLEIQLGEILTPFAQELPQSVSAVIEEFMNTLPEIFQRMLGDAQAIYSGDPAAKSIEEVIVAYPGFYAIAVHRIAHWFYNLRVPVFPRLLTELAHQFTGIDIHPGAEIGNSFCIDHGTGLVVGETTHIGNNVKLYQGVTLGALSVQKSLATQKRHPTIEDNVVVYSNATILGGDTIIGHDSVIGGNVWLTNSVAPNSIVYHKSEIHMRNSDESPKYS
jgi:serine O-acetyltransferase